MAQIKVLFQYFMNVLHLQRMFLSQEYNFKVLVHW